MPQPGPGTRIMERPRFVAALLAALLLAAPSLSTAQEPHDQGLAAQVAASVRSYPQFTVFDYVRGEIDQGIVLLTGKVTMPHKRREIEQRVARVEGVRAVRNAIEVLPASPTDELLRRRISRAIYGDPAFWRYAAMTSPPIHIIVERGRVTLAGEVGNQAERNLAQALAAGSGEVALVNELSPAPR
jgi:osmotically-inducible protein OsmY